jgi:hypothetical protein
MAKIIVHSLPSNSDQLKCLTEDLEQAYATGVDLGSCIPHILAGCDAFQQFLDCVDQALASLDVSCPCWWCSSKDTV